MQLARFGLVGETTARFFEAQPFSSAAALSYYTLLSMAPLLLVITGLGGFVIGQEAIKRELVSQMGALVGSDGAKLLATVIENARRPEQDLTSMAIGVVLMLFGATTVFAELQTVLNRAWGVEAKPRNAVSGFVRARLVSFAMVLGVGFLLLVSLVLTACVAALQRSFPAAGTALAIVDTLSSIVTVTVLLALLYKYVPDVHIAWRDTWIGAFLTAALFAIGKLAIGLYLGRASIGSPYGAAGSAVVLMVWVYYAGIIFFFGAVATKVIAGRRGSKLQPSDHAERTGDAPKRP